MKGPRLIGAGEVSSGFETSEVFLHLSLGGLA